MRSLLRGELDGVDAEPEVCRGRVLTERREPESVAAGGQVDCAQWADAAAIQVDVGAQVLAVERDPHDAVVRGRGRKHSEPVPCPPAIRERQRHETPRLGPAEELLTTAPHRPAPLRHVLGVDLAPVPGNDGHRLGLEPLERRPGTPRDVLDPERVVRISTYIRVRHPAVALFTPPRAKAVPENEHPAAVLLRVVGVPNEHNAMTVEDIPRRGYFPQDMAPQCLRPAEPACHRMP